MSDTAIEASFQLSFEQRQRVQNIEDWCCEYPDEAAHLIIGYADRLARAKALLGGVDDCIDHMGARDFSGDLTEEHSQWVESYREQVQAFLSVGGDT